MVNACDAGREGELIFAYLYEKAKGKKPVKRLWLNSMTNAAMKEALASLRPAEEFARLEQAARSRSEADWIVGMNATRAATIRLRSSFDGAVSLGRVQTPTLAIVARREEEIRAFKPEPYWLVDATFAADALRGRGAASASTSGTSRRRRAARATPRARASAPSRRRWRSSRRARAGRATITKLEKKEQREKAPMLYDLTTLQREANNRYGFSAKRTLAAAQRLYEEHKALTYPRTNSRYLTSDMVEEIKPIAELVGAHPEYRKGAEYVIGLDVLPLGAGGQRREGHRPPRDHPHPRRAQPREDGLRRQAHLRHGRAALPGGVPSRGGVREHARRDDRRGRRGARMPSRTCSARAASCCSCRAGAASTTRSPPSEAAEAEARGEEDEDAEQQLPRLLEPDEQVQTREIDSVRKETKPPRRYSDASLLGAMETAGKLVDDDELREAMKDSGIGTPATRAAIIERLITVGYVERDGRALVATEKGLNVIRLLNEHALTSPGLTGSWEQRLGKIERGEDSRKQFMSDIAGFARRPSKELDETLKDVRIPRATAGAVPGVRPRDRREPQGLLVLGARGSGLRLRDLEGESRQAAADGGRARADQDAATPRGGDRLSRAQRTQLPRAPRAQPDRGGQMAGRVRRAVGARRA